MKCTKENGSRISLESVTQQSGMKKGKGAKSEVAEGFSSNNGTGDGLRWEMVQGCQGMADCSCSCNSFSQASVGPDMIEGHFTQLLTQKPRPNRNPGDHRADLRRTGGMQHHSALFVISLKMLVPR